MRLIGARAWETLNEKHNGKMEITYLLLWKWWWWMRIRKRGVSISGSGDREGVHSHWWDQDWGRVCSVAGERGVTLCVSKSYPYNSITSHHFFSIIFYCYSKNIIFYFILLFSKKNKNILFMSKRKFMEKISCHHFRKFVTPIWRDAPP